VSRLGVCLVWGWITLILGGSTILVLVISGSTLLISVAEPKAWSELLRQKIKISIIFK